DKLKADSFIPLVPMLEVIVEAFRTGKIDMEAINQRYPYLGCNILGKNYLIFVPDAVPIDYGANLNNIYAFAQFS
ncbi:MAG: hypothetical protein HQL28_06605, partial [Candidatus Omnitrophica bacterium]|nr:hypothetical protein [Candidatus Omnitrophota bacterium]